MDEKKVDRVVGFVGDLLAIIALCLLYYLSVCSFCRKCHGIGTDDHSTRQCDAQTAL